MNWIVPRSWLHLGSEVPYLFPRHVMNSEQEWFWIWAHDCIIDFFTFLSSSKSLSRAFEETLQHRFVVSKLSIFRSSLRDGIGAVLSCAESLFKITKALCLSISCFCFSFLFFELLASSFLFLLWNYVLFLTFANFTLFFFANNCFCLLKNLLLFAVKNFLTSLLAIV